MFCRAGGYFRGMNEVNEIMASVVPLIKDWSPAAAAIAFVWVSKDIKHIKEKMDSHIKEIKDTMDGHIKEIKDTIKDLQKGQNKLSENLAVLKALWGQAKIENRKTNLEGTDGGTSKDKKE